MPDLEARLRDLPVLPHPSSAADVRREAERRRRRRTRAVAATGTLMAAAVLGTVVLWPTGDTRARGSVPLPSVVLQAAAEGPGGPRPLVDGGRLGADEAVVFRVTAGEAGKLTITADSDPVATFSVEPGEHFVGGEGPLAWTPDDGPSGAHEVTATLCTDGDRCASTSFRVHWAP